MSASKKSKTPYNSAWPNASLWILGAAMLLVIFLFSFRSYEQTQKNYASLTSLGIENKFEHVKQDVLSEYSKVLNDLTFFSANPAYSQYLKSDMWPRFNDFAQ